MCVGCSGQIGLILSTGGSVREVLHDRKGKAALPNEERIGLATGIRSGLGAAGQRVSVLGPKSLSWLMDEGVLFEYSRYLWTPFLVCARRREEI